MAFPFRIARSKSLCIQNLCFFSRDFIAGYHNAAPFSTIFSIEKIYCMHSCSRTCKKIDNQCIWVICNDISQGIHNRI